jgi:hypothetical protein
MTDADSSPHDENWILLLIRWAVHAEYNRAKYRIRQVYTRYPGISADQAATLIVDDSAFWAAIIGAGVGAINTIPGIGTVMAYTVVVPEVVYLTKLQISTALQIALVYDYDLDEEQICHLVLACVAYSYAFESLVEIARQFASVLTRRVIESVAKHAAMRLSEKVAEMIGVRLLAEGIATKVPLVAVPLNALMNYSGLQLFGLVAKKYFSPSYGRCFKCGSVQANCAVFCSNCGHRIRPDDDSGTFITVPVPA